jgi:VanZ family protein
VRVAAKFWLPVLIWMAMIFTASTDIGSTRHTSRFIGPFIRYFWPDVSAETIHKVQVAVRKTGHISGYAFFAMLVYRALQRGLFANGWSIRSAGIAEGASILYAITDELHQSTVPSRLGSPLDVLIDAIGAALGLATIWAIGKLRGKW